VIFNTSEAEMLLRQSWLRVARARALSLVVFGFMGLAPTASQAQLSFYGQNFEGMVLTDVGALSADGWLVYGNVFTPDMVYMYGYGPFPAPNGPPPAFCALETGQGGATQGLQQLSVFSDYENADHANGNLVESNVFQERTIGAADVGDKWYFEFDAKLGTLAGNTTAVAFIKTLALPSYALTNFITADMTSIPTTWNRYSISLTIDAGLVGQIFQFGFANTATNYVASGVFYDNVELTQTTTVSVLPITSTGPGIQMSVRGNPVIGGAEQVVAFAVPRAGRVTVHVYDVTGALVATLMDRDLAAGIHQAMWRGQDAAGRAVAPGLYVAEVVAGTERAVAKLSRLR
jgi:hypothetical protein